ncbi:MAG: PilZ domain-containing protein [Bacillota bacterium]
MTAQALPVRPPQACRVEWGGGQSLSSFVQDVCGREILVAGAPHEGPAVGTAVEVVIVQSQCMVGFSGVATRRQAGRLPGFWIECGEELGRTQRRRFVRHALSVRVRYAVLDGGENGGEEEVEAHLSTTSKSVDISGGGVSIHTPGALPVGAELALELDLPERPLYVTGQVLRCWPRPEAGWICALKFQSIEERERDRLIGIIFQDQRDLRKRGLM